MSKLVLARVGETEFDRMGVFANSMESSLSTQGRYEARTGGLVLAHEVVKFAAAYTGERQQAADTFASMMLAGDRSSRPPALTRVRYLNARNYGTLNDTSKRILGAKIGTNRLRHIQNSWDEPVEDGESLRQVHFRVKAFHEAIVLRKLVETPRSNVLVIADRDPLLAYRIELDTAMMTGGPEASQVPDSAVAAFEVGPGEMRVYSFDRDGAVLDATTQPLTA